MNINKKIFLLARNYCHDNFCYWYDKYQNKRFNNDYPNAYTDKDYDLFSRYIKLRSILKGLDLLTGWKYKTLNSCVQSLLEAADYQENLLCNQTTSNAEAAAIMDEKRKYQEFILSLSESDLMKASVKNIAYKKKLGKHEAEKVRKELHVKWNYNGDYWCPLIGVEPIKTLFLMKKNIIPFKKDIIDKVMHISKRRYYEIEETGDDYKYSIHSFDLDLYETICCDNTFSWVVYGSHENTISFGGELLIQKIESLFSHCEDILNKWEVDW